MASHYLPVCLQTDPLQTIQILLARCFKLDNMSKYNQITIKVQLIKSSPQFCLSVLKHCCLGVQTAVSNHFSLQEKWICNNCHHLTSHFPKGYPILYWLFKNMHKKVLVDSCMEGLLSSQIYHQTQLDMLKTFIFKQPYYYTSANDAKLCVVKN